MAPGEVVTAGVAWAPLKGIARVEVQLNEDPWIVAELTEPLSDKAWVQWKAALAVPEGDHVLRVRATDGTGETQTAVEMGSLPSAATGYHTINIKARA